MNTARVVPRPAGARTRERRIVFAMGVFAAFVTLSMVASDGSLGFVLLPLVVLVSAYAATTLPPSYSALALVFFALVLENPSEAPACGQFKTPLYLYGALLLTHLNLTLSAKWLLISGLDLVLAFLILLAWGRGRGARAAAVDDSAVAHPLTKLSLACLACTAWLFLWGALRGDADFGSGLWQAQRLVYLPIVFLLFSRTLRVPEDLPRLGKVVVAAAVLRALLAIYVRSYVPAPAGQPELQYATSHADSMLFVDGAAVLLATLLEPSGARRWLRFFGLLTVIWLGIKANTRRIAWVELGCCFMLLMLVSRRTRLKRRLARFGVLLAPALFIYGVVGWDSSDDLFKPVHVIRSVVDSKADASTEWRDWENYNLFYTIKQAPLLGHGLGHGYTEVVKLPDISTVYSLYRHIPHNSIMGTWAWGGLVGFSAIWMVIAAGFFLATRAYRLATLPVERAGALAAMAALLAYMIHCYGDMGLGSWTAVFTVAPALVVIGKLAVRTGAWRVPRGASG